MPRIWDSWHTTKLLKGQPTSTHDAAQISFKTPKSRTEALHYGIYGAYQHPYVHLCFAFTPDLDPQSCQVQWLSNRTTWKAGGNRTTLLLPFMIGKPVLDPRTAGGKLFNDGFYRKHALN